MTTQITISNHCLIEGATPEQERRIKDALTLPNPQYLECVRMKRYSGNIERYLHYYSETASGLVVPRGFACEIFKILETSDWIDKRRRLPEVDFTFTGGLRPYQVVALDAILKKDFGVFECPTGGGKTIEALALIAYRKQPALVIVPTLELMNQWADRAEQFLDGEHVGKIGGGNYSIKRLTIGVVNSVHNHRDELPQHFGHILVDEAHRCPAKTFSEIVANFDCRFMTGLTATPFRRDRLDRVINFYLGSLAHKVSSEELQKNGSVLKPEIRQIETSFHCTVDNNYSKLLTALTEDQARNIQITNEAAKHIGRGVVLIVSDRKRHLETIQALLDERGLSASMLTGTMKKSERSKVVENIHTGKIGIVLATVQLVGEGLDVSALTTLILATPIASRGRLIQACGRVRRPGPDKNPLVIDLADNAVGVLRHGARKRLTILKGL